MDGRGDRDLPREIAGWIQADRIPLEAEQIGRHHDPPLVTIGRRGKLEGELQRLHALGHVDVEGIHVDRVARPADRLTLVAGDDQPGQLVELAGRRVMARQPFRVEQDHRPRLRHRNRLLHPEDALAGIRRINVERQRAGIFHVLWRGNGVGERHRLRRGITRGHQLRRRGGRGEQDRGKGEGTEHRRPFGWGKDAGG